LKDVVVSSHPTGLVQLGMGDSLWWTDHSGKQVRE